jgi:putative transposase
MRTLRQAEERVVLAAMAIYADGTREILHYEIAQSESQAAWESFFKGLQERGLNLDGVEVVVARWNQWIARCAQNLGSSGPTSIVHHS